MRLFHATKPQFKESILSEGFKKNYGRFGTGVYFSESKTECLNFGTEIISVSIDKRNIKNINYYDLQEEYPYISFEEEEGITDLQNKGFKAIKIIYDENDSEICVYNTKIIKLISA